jgi:hypothetical protein
MIARLQDCSSHVGVASAHPFAAEYTFETGYSTSVIRVTYDTDLGKYWVQLKSRLRCFHSSIHADLNNLDDRDVETLATAVFEAVRHDFADGLGSHGITICALRDHFVVYAENESEIMSAKDLRDFALRIVSQFDTRHLPSFEEVWREVVFGLHKISDLARKDEEAERIRNRILLGELMRAAVAQLEADCAGNIPDSPFLQRNDPSDPSLVE